MYLTGNRCKNLFSVRCLSSEAQGGKSGESSCSACDELGGSTVVKNTIIKWHYHSVVSIRGLSVVRHLCLELLELCRRDGLNLSNDTPFDTFRARGSSEGTIIAPVVRHVNRAEELAHSNLTCGVIDSIKDSFEECVCCLASLYLIEEDSNDGTIQFCAAT